MGPFRTGRKGLGEAVLLAHTELILILHLRVAEGADVLGKAAVLGPGQELSLELLVAQRAELLPDAMLLAIQAGVLGGQRPRANGRREREMETKPRGQPIGAGHGDHDQRGCGRTDGDESLHGQVLVIGFFGRVTSGGVIFQMVTIMTEMIRPKPGRTGREGGARGTLGEIGGGNGSEAEVLEACANPERSRPTV